MQADGFNLKSAEDGAAARSLLFTCVRGGAAGHGGFTIGVGENTSLFNKVQRGRLIREGPGRAINILIQWRWEALPESQLEAGAFKENE